MSDSYDAHKNAVLITDNPEKPAFSEADEKILGKFNSQEDLEKGYQELEKKLHEPSDNQIQADDDTPPELPSDEAIEASDEEESTSDEADVSDPQSNDFREGVASAFEALQEDGELTEQVYEKFEGAGIPREAVDHIQELENYKQANELKEVTSEVADYPALQKWAGDNLSESEISIFDNIVENGTLDEMRFAVNNLNARMMGSTAPKQSRLIKADAIAQAEGGYQSTAEVQRDMKDPRYKTDSAYRQAVTRKLSKSNL